MLKKNFLPVFVVTFVVLLGSFPAFAQGEDSTNKVKAKKMFKEGVSYFESGKHAQALKAFQKSYKLRPHWAIRFNLGLCYKEIGMYTEAKEEFLGFLEEGGSKVKNATEKEVGKELAILSGIIATIEIDINVDGAEIWMDGKYFADLPIKDKIDMDPGSHLIAIHHEGYKSYEEEFILSKGERKSFNISLLPDEKGSADKDKKNNKNKNKKKKGGNGEIKIDTGKKTKKKWALPVFAASTALALASAATGSAMIAMAFNKKGEMDDIDKKMEDGTYDGSYEDYKNERKKITDEGELFATLTPVFYGVAGAAAVVAVVSVFVGHPFARSDIEQEPAAENSPLKNMGLSVLANGKENMLILQLNF